MNVPKAPKKLEQARKLRNEMGVSEKWMWSFLRNDKMGFRFRRQHVVGPYILDFYCPEAKLAIEVDGELHLNQKSYDESRDQYLSKNGIYVLRVPSMDIFSKSDPMELQRWLDSIQIHLIERTGREASKKILKPKRFQNS